MTWLRYHHRRRDFRLLRLGICLLLLSSLTPTTSAFSEIQIQRSVLTTNNDASRQHLSRRWHVFLAATQDNNSPQRKIGKKEGVYVRPSAAIERGSGFFIPGLEGAKVRVAVGVLLLVVNALVFATNTASTATNGNLFTQGLSAVFALLVLFQAAIEVSREEKRMNGDVATVTAESPQQVWQKRWSVPPMDERWKERVEWAASSYLALTPARNIILLGPGKVLFSLGCDILDVPAESCLAALETIANSTSGRVTIPKSHPAATNVPETTRCVVLQRVNDEQQICLMVLSDQLLASFTKQDLKWLGQLAAYVQP